jgi:sec-independent protein translocase protein TatB
MSGIGLGEILLILIVAIVVLGPKQLPRAMQHMNRLIKRFKQIKAAIARELES